MSEEHHIEVVSGGVLVGIASGGSILDFVATKESIEACLRVFGKEKDRTHWEEIGRFGDYPVTLVVPRSGQPSLMVDGPEVRKDRTFTAAIDLSSERLISILTEALKEANQTPEPTAPSGRGSS